MAVAVGHLHSGQTPSLQSNTHHVATGPVDVPHRMLAHMMVDVAVSDG